MRLQPFVRRVTAVPGFVQCLLEEHVSAQQGSPRGWVVKLDLSCCLNFSSLCVLLFFKLWHLNFCRYLFSYPS